MEKSESDKLKNYDAWAIGILIIGILFTIFAPYLFTRPWAWLDLSQAGEIGSSIGGMTAPFIGLTTAGLVYLSFRAQIKMNIRQWEEIKNRDKQKEKESSKEYILKLAELMNTNHQSIIEATNAILTHSDFKEVMKSGTELLRLLSPIKEIMKYYANKDINLQTLYITYIIQGNVINKTAEYIEIVLNKIKERIELDKLPQISPNRIELKGFEHDAAYSLLNQFIIIQKTIKDYKFTVSLQEKLK